MKKILLIAVAIFAYSFSSFAQTQTIAPGNWSNPAIWSAGVPTSTLNAVVRHAVTIDANSIVNSINVVSPSGSLTNSNFDLDVYGDITVSTPSGWIETGSAKTQMRGGSSSINSKIHFNRLRIYLNNKNAVITAVDSVFVKAYFYLVKGKMDVSSSALVLMASATSEANVGYSPGGSLTGPFIVQKYIDRCNEWSTYTTPISSSLSTIASSSNGRMIYTGFPGGVDYPTMYFVNTYFYDEASGYQTPSSTGDVVSQAQGFWYWNSDVVKNSNETSIPQEWLIQLTQSGFNTGAYNFSLSYSTDGFNLVGNPYPGVLNWNSGAWTKTNIEDAIYYYNTCTQSYASYVNGVGTNGGDRWISSFQGFFVQATAPGPALACDTKMLSLGTLAPVPLKNGEITDDEEEVYPFISMSLNGDETVFRFDQYATFEFDNGKDARKITPPSFVYDNSALRTRIDKNVFSVNALPIESQIIPLEVKGQGELSFIGASDFSDLTIYLEDLVTGDVVDMKLFNSYSFTNIEEDFTHRFNIIVQTTQQLSVTDESANDKLSVYPNPFNNEVSVTSNGVSFDRVDIYNVLGEKVLSEVSNAPNKNINVSSLSSGMYFIKVYNNNQEIGVYMTQKM